MIIRVPEPTALPLRTERLVLRAARDGDADDLHGYLGDAEVCRYLRHEPFDLVGCRNYLQFWTRDGAVSLRWLRFVVELEGQHVGFVSLDVGEHGVAEAGWVFRASVHGRSAATSSSSVCSRATRRTRQRGREIARTTTRMPGATAGPEPWENGAP